MKAQDDKLTQTVPWNNTARVSRSIPVSSIAPEHFSTEQINKLESRFSYQKWPDKTGIIIIAMECNLLAEDVEVGFLSSCISTLYLIVLDQSTKYIVMSKISPREKQ